MSRLRDRIRPCEGLRLADVVGDFLRRRDCVDAVSWFVAGGDSYEAEAEGRRQAVMAEAGEEEECVVEAGA